MSKSEGKRHRVNKSLIWLKPASELFPFGAISIDLIEKGSISIKDAGGARYYRNFDGTLTIEMNTVKNEQDNTKPLSHIFEKKEWGFVRKRSKAS